MAVADNGIGLSPENQARLFMPFEQAESGTSREFGGTGLGLAITKRIVELMDGRIWVESELGKGSKFCFTIKVQRGREELKSLPDPEESHDMTHGELKGKRLLVVEDVEINREIVLTLLEDTGLIIDCAENGREAVDILSSSTVKYDIVFMDIQMPVMDGYEAARNIRVLTDSLNTGVPIVAMTANVFKSEVDACFDAGMNDHVGKPIDIESVMSVLEKYLM